MAQVIRLTIDLDVDTEDAAALKSLVKGTFARKVGEFAAHSLAAATIKGAKVAHSGAAAHPHTDGGDYACDECISLAQRVLKD